MELTFKSLTALFGCALLSLGAGCSSTDLGKPVRVIENPYSPEAFDKLAASYYERNEYWRQDAKAVTQIEIYKIEGRNAVIMEQKILEAEHHNARLQVTTLKNIYLFEMVRKELGKPVWWIERTEIYELKSSNPSDNPALNTPAPKDPAIQKILEPPAPSE